jgi:hypothetical protein
MQRMLGGGRETLFRYWMWYAVYGTMCSNEVGRVLCCLQIGCRAEHSLIKEEVPRLKFGPCGDGGGVVRGLR